MKQKKNRSERERREDLLRGAPVKGIHGKSVVLALADGELLLEIGKGKELVGSVEVLVVLAVAAFDLAVVSGGIRSDELVADAELG